MMPILLWVVKSSKSELKIVLATLGVLIILPAFSMVVFAASGVSLIGDALAAINPVTKLVELFDPNGNKVAEIELSVHWPARGYITDEFGTHEQWRRDLGLGPHSGIDIGNVEGEPITPFMSGNVAWVDTVDDSACGKGVKLTHDHNITSVYCHLDSAVELPVGTEVHPGDVIGYMGNTGTSTGSHLHFGIRVYGILVNPRTFMVGDPEPGNAKLVEAGAGSGHVHDGGYHEH